jgi:hypothetical protein
MISLVVTEQVEPSILQAELAGVRARGCREVRTIQTSAQAKTQATAWRKL